MRSVLGRYFSEQTIEKSRFLTYSAHVETEEEAREFLAEIRKQHSTATHVCFGFVADKLGNLCRFSDDGEPSGTAGMPILDVIQKQKLFETCVAVVRYFGGIKLGAGGLVRAYSSSASQNLSSAPLCDWERCQTLRFQVAYSEFDALQRVCAKCSAEVLATDYADSVCLTVAVRAETAEICKAKVVDDLQGKVKITVGESFLHPFPVT